MRGLGHMTPEQEAMLREFSKAFDHFMALAGFTPIGQDEHGLLWRPEDYKPILASIEHGSRMVPGSDERQ